MSPRTTITTPAFKRASAMVRAMRYREWTNEPPKWAFYKSDPAGYIFDWDISTHTRAVQTAEAFIILFTMCNPNFRQDKFLYECGLGPKPLSKRHKDPLMTRTNSREPNREELL